MRVIHIICDAGHIDTIKGIADQYEVTECWWSQYKEEGGNEPSDETGSCERCHASMLVSPAKRQQVLDALQKLFDTDDDAHILISPVETVLSKKAITHAGLNDLRSSGISRQELFDEVSRGARLDRNYLLLVILSTLVAAIGLIENNVAVVIGAMVIAPLLGPNIALALGSALGNTELIVRALKAAGAGLALAVILGVIISMLWPLETFSPELLSRTDVNLAGIALALASGAAGALSLTTGLSAVLVGVMVAVAILPPAATVGIMMGHGNWPLAGGALLLLAANIICINLSAKVTFLLRGIQPRTWAEKQKAKTSVKVSLTMWTIFLVTLILLLLFRTTK